MHKGDYKYKLVVQSERQIKNKKLRLLFVVLFYGLQLHVHKYTVLSKMIHQIGYRLLKSQVEVLH